jgi:hypothetical protein
MRRRRVRTPKSDVRVKTKPAKRRAKCTACQGHIYPGDTATYVTRRTKRYHEHCTPANIGSDPTGARPGPPPLPKTPAEAIQVALVAFDNAIVLRAQKQGITPEMEKAFQRYTKLKALAFDRGAADNEAAVALRMALTDAIKLVF